MAPACPSNGGGQGPGRTTVREWRHPGLSPSHKNSTDNETKFRMMPGFEGELREVEAGTHRLGGTCNSEPPRGCKPRSAKGGVHRHKKQRKM